MPIDPEDDKARLEKYLAKWKPAYRMLIDLPIGDRAEVTSFLATQTGAENPPLPSSVVTDAAGNALLVTKGIPSVSDLRRTIGW